MCRYSEIAPTRVAGRREFRFPTMRHNSCVVEERDYVCLSMYSRLTVQPNLH